MWRIPWIQCAKIEMQLLKVEEKVPKVWPYVAKWKTSYKRMSERVWESESERSRSRHRDGDVDGDGDRDGDRDGNRDGDRDGDRDQDGDGDRDGDGDGDRDGDRDGGWRWRWWLEIGDWRSRSRSRLKSKRSTRSRSRLRSRFLRFLKLNFVGWYNSSSYGIYFELPHVVIARLTLRYDGWTFLPRRGWWYDRVCGLCIYFWLWSHSWILIIWLLYVALIYVITWLSLTGNIMVTWTEVNVSHWKSKMMTGNGSQSTVHAV